MKNILVLLLSFLLVSYVGAQVHPPPESAQTEISKNNTIIPLSGVSLDHAVVVSYYTPVVVNTGNVQIENISYVAEPLHSPSKVPRQNGNLITNSVASSSIAITTSANVPFQYQRGKVTYYR